METTNRNEVAGGDLSPENIDIDLETNELNNNNSQPNACTQHQSSCSLFIELQNRQSYIEKQQNQNKASQICESP
ncbi:264_t:CDS:2, partial [Racocetra persica]